MVRRSVLGGVLTLGGCGFRPIYRATADSAVNEDLSHIYVPVLAERSGQLLRQALQQRLDGAEGGHERRYELVPVLKVGFEGIGIQRDNSSTRTRVDASADWTLRALAPGRTILVGGSSRVLDGYNVIDQQFFAAELESDAALRRITAALADQITVQLGIFFLKRAKAV